MYKMIVIDLDNTLLTEEKIITKFTKDILYKYQKLGFKLIIATAKSEKAARPYLEFLYPDAVIYNNGSLIKSNQNIIYEKMIPNHICRDLIHFCTECYGLENTKVVTQYGDFTNSLHNINSILEYNDYNNFPYDAYKITIKTEEEIACQIAQKYKECSVFRFENRNSFVFTQLGANKGTAVKKIAVQYDIDIDDVIAFGDDSGDIEMLKICGMGIAVANAKQDVKKIANDICESNENDGVAKWIEKHII